MQHPAGPARDYCYQNQQGVHGGQHHDPNMPPGLAVNSQVEGDTQCNTEDSCEAAAVAQGLTYVDAKPNRATMGCYTYSSGNYAGSVYFGKGGTDEENNAVLHPPKYRFCGPNKTDTSSAWYIEAERGNLHIRFI